MKAQNFYLKLTLLVIATAMLSACGASKGSSNGSDSSSRLAVTDITSTDTSTRPLAYCNQATGTQMNIGVSIYQDGETIANDRVNFKILKIPSYFAQNQNYIEFYAYSMDSNGNKVWSSNRKHFNIYALTDGKLIASGKDSLLWADLQSAAQYVGAATPDQFFRKARLVIDLEDSAGDYDVIVARYINAADDSLVGSTEALIPVFDADPARYNLTHHSELQKMHPFKGQSWSMATYQTKAQEFCKPIYTAQ